MLLDRTHAGHGPRMSLVERFLREEDALELVEWALLALIFTGVIGGYLAFRTQVIGLVDSANEGFLDALTDVQSD